MTELLSFEKSRLNAHGPRLPDLFELEDGLDFFGALGGLDKNEAEDLPARQCDLRVIGDLFERRLHVGVGGNDLGLFRRRHSAADYVAEILAVKAKTNDQSRRLSICD